MAEALLQDGYNFIMGGSIPPSPDYVNWEESNRWLESESCETDWGVRELATASDPPEAVRRSVRGEMLAFGPRLLARPFAISQIVSAVLSVPLVPGPKVAILNRRRYSMVDFHVTPTDRATKQAHGGP